MALPRRKNKKKIETVTFTLDDFDGKFEVPSMKSLDLGVQRKLRKGDLDPMVEALGEYAAIVDDLVDDEVTQFMDAWAEASGLDLGKSGPAAS